MFFITIYSFEAEGQNRGKKCRKDFFFFCFNRLLKTNQIKQEKKKRWERVESIRNQTSQERSSENHLVQAIFLSCELSQAAQGCPVLGPGNLQVWIQHNLSENLHPWPAPSPWGKHYGQYSCLCCEEVALERREQ